MGEHENKPVVFISHISEEKEFALRLQSSIASEFAGKIETFVSSDLTSIQAGEQWLPAVDDALRRTSVMLVLCSSVSVARPWIQFESGAAWMKSIPVVPVCFAGMTPSDLPMPLGYLQGANASEKQGIIRIFQRLAESSSYAPRSGSIDEIHRDLSTIESKLIKHRRDSVATVVRRSTFGWALVGLSPFLVSTVYGMTLKLTQGDLESSESALNIAGVVFGLLIGCLYQLTQSRINAGLTIFAATIFAVLSGVFSSVFYFELGSSPETKFFSSRIFDIIAYLVYVSISFIAGVVIGDRIREYPETMQIIRRIFFRNV